MARLKQRYGAEGFYGIGVMHSEDEANFGTLWRTAFIFGASFIFTIGRRYRKQSSDVTRAWSKIPLFHYETFSEFRGNLPYSTQLVGVELTEGATALSDFVHPARCVYLLGCESVGLSADTLSACHSVVSLPGEFSLNVAVSGSIVAYDRQSKIPSPLPKRRID